ncbi:hypothetical protein ABZX40_15800 [Streptomyces sp. NPDC004610]|uniref:hypothetical protein n=1 Tax=unclassified Streptomyces TaxID=2593676 RepID=UPI00339F160D
MSGRTPARNGRPPAPYARALAAALIATTALIAAANAGPAKATPGEASPGQGDRVTHSARP